MKKARGERQGTKKGSRQQTKRHKEKEKVEDM